MININNLQDTGMIQVLKLNNILTVDRHSIQDANKHENRILDAKYKKTDLQSNVRDSCKHLSANQQKKLLQLLKKYETLLDGTLGDWKNKPVSFKLREGVSR